MHKYTSVARGRDGVNVKNIIDLVLVKKDMLPYVQDVSAVRGMGRGLSDDNVVLCKVKLVGAWIKRREVVNRARRIRNKKLKEHHSRRGWRKYC